MAKKKRRAPLGGRRKKKKVTNPEAPPDTDDTSEGLREKDLAHWKKGDAVQICTWVPFLDKKGAPYHDPNDYLARCLTSDTFPALEVIDEDTGERHAKFPRPLFKGEYTIWGRVF